ncbi:MAG: alpha/beta fold hydrolase [Aestuariivirgaceae bacterium]
MICAENAVWREFHFSAPDGLRLFGRECGAQESSLTPLLCLAGLTRNSKDFEPMAAKLRDRRIVAFDYRGRGQSEYCDHASYTPRYELADCLALLDHLRIDKVCVVGTSRGGIIALLMAQFHETRIAGAVLNDIGPRLEKEGLVRIARQIRRRSEFRSWIETAEDLSSGYPEVLGLTQADWLCFARRLYKEKAGSIVRDYDPALALAFPSPEEVTRETYPQLWTQFSALKGKPCAVLRGEFSDLLSETTVHDMTAIHAELITVCVRGRGHVPFLDEPESIEAVDRVAELCDRLHQQN